MKHPIEEKTAKKLLQVARQARKKAYAPYSGYHVGAALLTAKGRIESGYNIENSSFGASVCAERIAVFKAYSDGYRRYHAIAVVAEGKKFPFLAGFVDRYYGN